MKCFRMLWLLLGLIASFQSLAMESSCKLKGNWYDNTQNIIAVFSENSKGETTLFESYCKRRSLEISETPTEIKIQLSPPSNALGPCAIKITWTGQFSPDCMSINGTVEVDEKNRGNFSWYAGSHIVIIEPSNDKELLIPKEPRMPNFDVWLAFTDGKPLPIPTLNNISTSPLYHWKLTMHHKLGETGIILHDEFTDTTEQGFYSPPFEKLEGLRGGTFHLSVSYQDIFFDEKTYIVKGTNPGKEMINAVLNPTMRHIACVESSYRQFESDREDGIGFPLIGKNKKNKEIGGIGLMQLYNPPASKEAIWNWRENISAAMKLFDDKQTEAKNLHITERSKLNKERAKIGLEACPKNYPTPLNLEQLERETLRRYNCGREYRWEPRDAKNCEGNWVIDPSCIRNNTPGAEIKYVDKILACNI